ncbi:MAG: hypothetical protein PHV99_00120 [Candidatus Pacebacteria bacterium]|nr:hypothetical protein [Candidatus Paceibacterota bacterium]
MTIKDTFILAQNLSPSELFEIIVSRRLICYSLVWVHLQFIDVRLCCKTVNLKESSMSKRLSTNIIAPISAATIDPAWTADPPSLASSNSGPGNAHTTATEKRNASATA